MLYRALLAVTVLPLLTAADLKLDADSLQISSVKVDRVQHKGKDALRVTDTAPDVMADELRYAIVKGSKFEDGVIEVELAGDTLPNANPTYRGFTGIAFRVADGGKKYECFYLRPKNGRAEDQEQRNHSTQYISVPGNGWRKLRTETPSKYESYVDLVPGEWTHVRIEVRGDKAKLFVNHAAQPTLIVNDLKHGKSSGAIALWVGPGTVAHFANLKVQ